MGIVSWIKKKYYGGEGVSVPVKLPAPIFKSQRSPTVPPKASQKDYVLGSRSRENLVGVHEDLIRIVERAIEITDQDFTVIEGIRTKARQRMLVSTGKSQTLKSYHLTGHAVDVVPYPIDWNDLNRFRKVAEAMKQAADELGIELVWGGDWPNFYDGPHYQISRGT